MTGECASIYIRHIGEAHYVSTAQKQVSQISNKNKIDMTLTGSKVFGWGGGILTLFFCSHVFCHLLPVIINDFDLLFCTPT